MSDFATGRKVNTSFIIKNIDPRRRAIKIFGTKLGYLNQIDLLEIPGIGIDDIKTSLLRGFLSEKLRSNILEVVFSDLETNAAQEEFLAAENVVPQWQDQTVWYIDAVNGNDENNGNSQITAIKTFKEFERRINGYKASSNIIVNILSDIDENVDLNLHIKYNYDTENLFTIRGVKTELFSGSITSLTNWDSATETSGSLTCSSISGSWTSSDLLDKQIELTSGLYSGAKAWTTKDLGSKSVRFSPFYDENSFASVDPSVLNTFKVYRLPRITGNFSVNHNAGFSIALRDLIFYNDIEAAEVATLSGNYIICFNCHFKNYSSNTLSVDATSSALYNCYVDTNYSYLYNNVAINGGLITGLVKLYGGTNVTSNGNFLLQGSNAQIFSSGYFNMESTNWIAMLEVVDPITIDNGVFKTDGKIWGSGTGTGYNINAGSILLYNTSYPITYTTSDDFAIIGGISKTSDLVPFFSTLNSAGIVTNQSVGVDAWYMLKSGTNRAAVMQAALDAGFKKILLFQEGNYTFESMITLTGGTHDDVTIEAVDGAIIIPPQGSTSNADRGNLSCWLKAVPASLAVETTVTAQSKTGQNTITVLSGTGITANSYIKVESTRDCTFSTSTGTFTSTNHQFQANDPVRLWAGDPTADNLETLPSAFSSDTIYYVRDVAANTFKLATAPAGVAITGGTLGNGTVYVSFSATQDIFLSSDAASIKKCSVYEIDSVASNTLTVKDTLQQYIQRSCKVTLINPVKNLTIKNITLSNIDGQTASGLRLESVIGGKIDIKGSGFSRSVVDIVEGSVNLDVLAKSEGQVNAIILIYSSHKCKLTAEMKRNISDRTHAYGIPRGLVTANHRCNLLDINNCYLTGSFCGINIRGLQCFTIRDSVISDMVASAAGTRDHTVVYTGSTPYGKAPGISINQFQTSNYGAYSHQGSVFNVIVDQCSVEYFQLNSPFHWSSAVVISDVYGFYADNLHITNKGADSTSLFSGSSGKINAGLTLFDAFDFTIGNCRIDGQSIGLIFYNTNSGSIHNLVINNLNGDSTAEQYGIFQMYGYNNFVKITNLFASSVYPFVMLSPSVISEESIIIDNFYYQARAAKNAFLAYNNSGDATAIGEILERNTTGFSNPTTGEKSKQAIVIGYGANNNSWGFVVNKGRRLVRVLTAEAVQIGDKIRAAYEDATPANRRRGKVDNAATYGSFIGIATTSKSAGVGEYIYIEDP